MFNVSVKHCLLYSLSPFVFFRLLDTSSRSSGTTSRLITAMLAERPFQSTTSTPSLTAYNTASVSGNTPSIYKMNVDATSLSNQYKNRMYNMSSNTMSNNVSAADSSSGSPPSSLPASVPPNANNTSEGYRSYDEESGYGAGYIPSRKQREFIPENKKDEGYWEKRRKNNEAARRSREKRRIHDMALENRIMDLTRENCKLRNELGLIKKKFGLPLEETFSNENNEPIATLNTSQNIPTTLTQQSSLHSEFATSRYTNGMQKAASPRSRSMSISGPMQSSYLTSFQHHPPATQPQPFIPNESYYVSRDQSDSDLKSYSGKYEAQSPFHLKSMKDDNHYQQTRVDDQVRPSYSTSLPPNQISPYSRALPVSSQKSYWIPTTDLTSSDSNDESEFYDRVQDQPLSLVKKRPSTENESCEDNSNSSRASNSPTNNPSGLPLKLRHKVSHDSSTPESPPTTMPSYANGLAHLSDIALLHSNRSSFDDYSPNSAMDSFKIRPRSYTNPRSLFDIKYVERRRRNNEAARKCRENRKQLTKLREVKSGYLENENGKLKEELMGLQEEMRELRDLLEKKRQTRENDNSDANDREGDIEQVNGEESEETGLREEEDMYVKMEEEKCDPN